MKRPASNGTLAEALAAGPNNLDAIRLVAAVTVLVSHAYILTGHPADEPIARALSHSIDGGALAVDVFFILSGLLIARSAQRHTTSGFVLARARRILPAYLVVILLQAFLLGPALTTLPLATYLATPSLWSGLASAVVFAPHPGLPGVFAANPLPDLVNASLWTLRIEILCYAATLALARLHLLRPGRILLPLAIPWAITLAIAAARTGLIPAGAPGAVLTDLRATSITACALHFMMGATAWAYRDTLRPNLWWAGAGALAALLLAPTPLATLAWPATLPAIILALGFAKPVTAPLTSRTGDLSYGTYLYAFPVAQTLLAFLQLTPTQLILLALPPTLLLAAASSRLIERPALHLRTITAGPAPTQQTNPHPPAEQAP